jgi:hypothetical protein
MKVRQILLSTWTKFHGILQKKNHIDATYEMRTTEYGEICISIDD